MKSSKNKHLPPSDSRLQKVLRILLTVAGSLCLLYYCLVAFVAGLIHTSILFIWIVGGILCLLLAAYLPPLLAWLKRRKRWALILMATPLALCILLFLAGEIAIFSGFSSNVPDQDADYLIVLGAKVNPNGPSLTLQKRIDAAYEYLSEHPSTVAIASGGQGADEPMSEARCIADELIARGISPERILLDERSTDTAENIAFSRELIDDSPDRSVLVVSNNFHCFRASGIARRCLDAKVGHISADTVFFLLPHYLVREFAGLTVDFLQGNMAFES